MNFAFPDPGNNVWVFLWEWYDYTEIFLSKCYISVIFELLQNKHFTPFKQKIKDFKHWEMLKMIINDK